MSSTVSAPLTPRFALANVWGAFGTTLVGIGVVATAVAPLFSGQMPTTVADWAAKVIAIVTAGMAALHR